ncbi:MAG TPA: type II secretion system F family protein [Actinomycetales bacterium]|nr:type II secretion system F family protein [Actinomycetales bacterium]
MTAAVVVTVCLAGAALMVATTPVRRLHRVVRPSPPVSRPARSRSRRARSGTPDCAAAVAELATLLRAGLVPARAWQSVAGSPGRGAEVDAALVAAADAETDGRDVATALRQAVESHDPALATAIRALAAAWQVAARVGAPPAVVLERLAVSLREEADLADATATAMAGPRATAQVLAALPPLGLVLGQLVGASPVQTLVGTPAGRACAVVGVLLTAVGWWWARLLVRRAAPTVRADP